MDDLHRAYVALVTGMFPLSSAIGPPLAALRSAGTLLEHAARHRTVTAEMADARSRLRRATGPEREAQLDRFLEDFGHRGVYESDIARPRYRDDPATLADTGADESAMTRTPPQRTLRGRLTLPIWWLAVAPIRARELLRHDAMRAFASIRRSFVSLATEAVREGRLRTVEDVWLLDADEARRLDAGWIPDDAFWASATAERARTRRHGRPARAPTLRRSRRLASR